MMTAIHLSDTVSGIGWCAASSETVIRLEDEGIVFTGDAGFTHEPGGLLTEVYAGRSLIQAIRDERYDGRFSSVLRRAR
jgi:hypothetical protein